MKLCVILNASAGSLIGGALDEARNKVAAGFAANGHEAELKTPQGETLVETLREAATGDYDAIIIGGGDGTIATAADICAAAGMPLGVLPLGTMNMLAKDLKIPLVLEDAIAALSRGDVAAIDMGAVNGQVFLCNSTLGLVPMVGRERENQRGKPWASRITGIAGRVMMAGWRWPGLKVTLEYDGQCQEVVTRLLTIANNAYERSGGQFLSRASLDAGVLTTYVARHRSRLGLAWFSLGLFMGFWQRDPDLTTITGTAMIVHARKKSLLVSNDGEILRLQTPLRYEIRAGALKVLKPSDQIVVQAAERRRMPR